MSKSDELRELTAEGLELLQQIGADADAVQFKILQTAGPDAAAYQVELPGNQFRWLVAILQKAANWQKRFAEEADRAGLKSEGHDKQ